MDYDLIIAGGGLAGASLGAVMAQQGARVLIVEREPRFRDRVRGEGMMPWGVAEASQLGIDQTLLTACAQEVQWMAMHDGTRDLVETTPSRRGFLSFHHPDMQQCLLDCAASAGAEVLRPAEVTEVTPGDPPAVAVRSEGATGTLTARLVVGADGRNSRVRASAGFAVRHDPDCLITAGTLYRGMKLPADSVQMLINPDQQCLSIAIPVGGGRHRLYSVFRHDRQPTLNGERDQDRFIASFLSAGAPAAGFGAATCIGPLASFSGADSWTDHPYRSGVVLIGDAAAASDPAFGCGLALTLRDVRVLRDRLAACEDWRAPADAYAAEQAVYRASLNAIHGLWRELFFAVGDAADARRARALPRFGEDPSRLIDFTGLGPDAPCDAAARARFFGED
jgi:menaquinone-9 beta-reductase